MSLLRRICIALTIIHFIFPLSSAGQELVLGDDGPVLAGEPSPSRYFDVTGRKAFLMGYEGGAMEAWILPFKAAHNIRLGFSREDWPAPRDSEALARWLEVHPGYTVTDFAGEDFRVRALMFAPIDEPALVVLLQPEVTAPLTVSLSFMPDLQPMWPAGLGGQYARWDDDVKAFILSESRRRYNVFIGSPRAARGFSTPAHRLAESPNRFEIELGPEDSSAWIPVVIAGGGMERGAARELYERVAGNHQALLIGRVDHARRLLRSTLRIDSPDDDLDRAVTWATIALDDGLCANPDLGAGLVAGYGLSGSSARPGFAWYFGGDLFFNQFALNGSGSHETVKKGLELIRRNQREDGKIMHELSQSAGMIDWFGDYPYGFYHIETSPYYIIAVWNTYQHTGDAAWLRDYWPSLLKAYEYTLTTETDGDGLPENSKGGLGALEVGAFLDELKTDIYVAGIWVRALDCLADAATVLGETVPEGMEDIRALAHESLQTLFFNEDIGFHALALSMDGSAVSELTVWAAVPLMFRLMPAEQALATLRMLAMPEIATDWGMRMLTERSSVYDPTHYNNGAVWPFTTGYAAMAQYANRRPEAGRQLIQALLPHTFANSRGDISEVYSGAFNRPLDASVDHQLFSSGGLLGAVTRGLLGIHPDAAARRVVLEPQLPPEWSSLEVERIPLPGASMDLRMRWEDSTVVYELATEDAPMGWKLCFAPSFPVQTEVTAVTVNGAEVEFELTGERGARVLELERPLEALMEIRVEVAETYWLQLPPPSGRPGQGQYMVRYIDSWREADGTWAVELAGRAGETYELKVMSRTGANPVRIQFPGSGGGYTTLVLSFRGDRVYASAEQ